MMAFRCPFILTNKFNYYTKALQYFVKVRLPALAAFNSGIF